MPQTTATVLGVALLVTAVVWGMYRTAYEERTWSETGVVISDFYRLGLVLLAAAVIVAAYELLLRRLRPWDLAVAALFWWLVGAVAVAVTVPGASYLLTWPLAGASLGLLAAVLLGARQGHRHARRAVQGAAAEQGGGQQAQAGARQRPRQQIAGARHDDGDRHGADQPPEQGRHGQVPRPQASQQDLVSGDDHGGGQQYEAEPVEVADHDAGLAPGALLVSGAVHAPDHRRDQQRDPQHRGGGLGHVPHRLRGAHLERDRRRDQRLLPARPRTAGRRRDRRRLRAPAATPAAVGPGRGGPVLVAGRRRGGRRHRAWRQLSADVAAGRRQPGPVGRRPARRPRPAQRGGRGGDPGGRRSRRGPHELRHLSPAHVGRPQAGGNRPRR